MKTNNLLKLSVVALLATFVTLTACKKDEEEENNAPTVEILSPTEGGVVVKGQDLIISVDASDPDGNLASVSILLNDSEIENLTQPPYEATVPTGTAEETTHTIKVIATDANQLTAEDMITFSIVAEPMADFTSKGEAGIVDIPVSFIDNTTGVPTEWQWDFGDGTTSNEQNPQHTYSSPGAYTVILTATNAAGTDTNTQTDYIKIFQFDKFELVDVEGGSFEMGSDSDNDPTTSPVHAVTLDGFQIGKYEVTNEQFAVFLNEKGVSSDGYYEGRQLIELGPYCQVSYNDQFVVDDGKDYYPNNDVTWYGAKAFCDYFGLNLPTEAQWEFAARGGIHEIKTTYAGSNTLYEVGWYNANSFGSSPYEVGLLLPNEIGLYDMSGNASEWCYDWYSSSYYSSGNNDNPTGPEDGDSKVVRSGSCGLFSIECTVYYRTDWTTYHGFGFRVAYSNE